MHNEACTEDRAQTTVHNVINDLEALTALAHPRRQRVFEYLALHGPVTSAGLARDLGLNTGATSYHLRELAKHGFVEEVPGKGCGRERWWQAVRRDRRFPPRSEQSPEMRIVLDEMNRMSFDADLDSFARFQAQRESMGDWGDQVPYSRALMHLTIDEVREFFEEYIKLVNRYTKDETPADARPVLARFIAFPAPGND